MPAHGLVNFKVPPSYRLHDALSADEHLHILWKRNQLTVRLDQAIPIPKLLYKPPTWRLACLLTGLYISHVHLLMPEKSKGKARDWLWARVRHPLAWPLLRRSDYLIGGGVSPQLHCTAFPFSDLLLHAYLLPTLPNTGPNLALDYGYY